MTRRPREIPARFKVAHELPGRVRLVGNIIGNPALDTGYVAALVGGLPGVESVRINESAASIVIEYNGNPETRAGIQPMLDNLPKEAFTSDPNRENGPDMADVAVQGAAAALTPFLPQPVAAAMSWFLAVPSFMEGAETLLTRGLKIEVLDASVKALSLLRGDYFTSNTVGALITLGEYMESSAERKTNDLLKNLLKPQVETVRVERDGKEVMVPFDRVAIGDTVVCGPGELIPVDGTVRSGNASVNASSVTGESEPVPVEPGDEVVSGAVIEEGKIFVQADQVGAETSMARIAGYLEKSLRNKSPSQKRSEELADKLVPLTFGAGALLYALTGDMRRAASVLTVDYSCAVKLSYPVAVRSAMFAAGKEGILLKGARALDALASVDTFVFDKTGTLTRGELHVTDVLALDGTDRNAVLALAAGAEQHYGHPVARAVVAKAKAEGLALPGMSNVDFIVAHGVSAYVDDARVLVGSRHFIHEDEHVDCGAGDEAARELREQGKSLLYVARDGRLAGLIAMRDELRPEAGDVLRALKDQGVSRLVVLTGDHERTARAVCANLPELDEVHAELKPEDKAALVEDMRDSGRKIAFVGDGVNDAPSLLAAHVGVCMPGGADLAREAARVVLLKDDIRTLPTALGIAKRTDQTLRRCVGGAVGINSAVMALAGAGLLPAVLAAAAHNGSTLGILAYAGWRGMQPPEHQPPTTVSGETHARAL